MKLVLVIVSIIAVFSANCRDLPDGFDDQGFSDNAQFFAEEPKDLAFADDSQDEQDLEKESLIKTGIIEPYYEEEEGETESRLRRSKCKARNSCVVMGGFCVTNATLCNARLVPEGCKGTNCQCCVPDTLEIKFEGLEVELQTMKSNLTSSIEEAVNQCVDETTMKETVIEGSNNITRALETKIQQLETELQRMNNSLTRSIKGCPEGFFMINGPISQCFKYFTDKDRSWTEAKAKCHSEGLVLAKPYDPLALRIYILTRYGNNRAFAWLDAQGDGSKFVWVRDGSDMTTSNRYWYHGEPGSHVATTNCLYLRATESYWKSYPDQPYTSGSCTSGFRALCELLM